MTDKQLEIKHWLNRAFYADKKVKALEILLKQHRERAEGFAVCCECNDKGKSSGRKNSTEDALIRLADIEQKLQQQIAELSGITAEIVDAVSKLCDNDLETVLIHRYLLFHTVEETAELMNYSPRTVRDKQKKAIEKLCLLLPCFAG